MSSSQPTPLRTRSNEEYRKRMNTNHFHSITRSNYLHLAGGYLNGGVDINGIHEHPKFTFLNARITLRHCVTALFNAAERGRLDTVEFLLDWGADVRTINVVRFFGRSRYRRKGEMERVEGLSALDGMRMSRCREIRELAVKRYGPESREEMEKRILILENMKAVGTVRRGKKLQTRSQTRRLALSETREE